MCRIQVKYADTEPRAENAEQEHDHLVECELGRVADDGRRRARRKQIEVRAFAVEGQLQVDRCDCESRLAVVALTKSLAFLIESHELLVDGRVRKVRGGNVTLRQWLINNRRERQFVERRQRVINHTAREALPRVVEACGEINHVE